MGALCSLQQTKMSMFSITLHRPTMKANPSQYKSIGIVVKADEAVTCPREFWKFLDLSSVPQ